MLCQHTHTIRRMTWYTFLLSAVKASNAALKVHSGAVEIYGKKDSNELMKNAAYRMNLTDAQMYEQICSEVAHTSNLREFVAFTGIYFLLLSSGI